MDAIVTSTKTWFARRNDAWLQNDDLADLHAASGRQPAIEEMVRRRQMHKRRGAKERKIISDVDITVLPSQPQEEGSTRVRVHERMRFLYELGDRIEHEQREIVHELLWRHGHKPLLEAHRHVTESSSQEASSVPSEAQFMAPDDWQGDYRGVYNRTLAFRYAEQWWNSRNPQYANMGVDCTNFVSQVLHAGGFAMQGGSKRDAGWWYRAGQSPSWSYSWAVAHSLALLLGQRPNLFRAQVVQTPQELTIGDVIAYDWTGSGRFGHNTVVVGQDAHGMPLVNAHTVDSHQRFYSYEDSYAWTPQTRYLFIHFLD